MGFLIVFLGAGLGGARRHGVNLAVMRLKGTGFSSGTLAVNVRGCFLMGLIVERTRSSGLPQPLRLFVTTGLLGGLTTFPAFSLDVAQSWKRGQAGAAAPYATASAVLSLGALFLGLNVVRAALAGGAS